MVNGRRWRVGQSYGIHVYEESDTTPEGDRPVATFFRPVDAERAVKAVNDPAICRDAARVPSTAHGGISGDADRCGRSYARPHCWSCGSENLRVAFGMVRVGKLGEPGRPIHSLACNACGAHTRLPFDEDSFGHVRKDCPECHGVGLRLERNAFIFCLTCEREKNIVHVSVLSDWVSPYRPQIGDPAQTVLTGVITGFDSENGIIELEGSAADGHVPWKYQLHWSTEFTRPGELTIYDELREERKRAHRKHGETSMESTPVQEMYRAVILGEEIGEMAEVVWALALVAAGGQVDTIMNDGRHAGEVNLTDLRRELLQVATMAAAWADRIEVPTDVR